MGGKKIINELSVHPLKVFIPQTTPNREFMKKLTEAARCDVSTFKTYSLAGEVTMNDIRKAVCQIFFFFNLQNIFGIYPPPVWLKLPTSRGFLPFIAW